MPRADNALKIAQALAVNLEWLLSGEDQPLYATADAVRSALGDRADDGSRAELDLVAVNDIDFAYGLGGTYSDMPIEQTVQYFPRTWIESITSAPPSQLAWTRPRGDSMAPTINDGDLVLFNLAEKTVKEQDAIWAFTIGDIASIKRLRMRKDRVLILSDNDRVPAEEVSHEEVNIVGRVIFIGRRV